MYALEVFAGFVQIGLKIADGFFFFVHKIINRALRGEFRQTQLHVARLHELVVILAHFVEPRLHFGAYVFFQTAFVCIFVDKAHDIEAFAHMRAVGLLQNRHLLGANQADGRIFIIVQ